MSDIDKAIEQWKFAAKIEHNPHLLRSINDTIKALEIERDTVISVCNCCFLSRKECKCKGVRK